MRRVVASFIATALLSVGAALPVLTPSAAASDPSQAPVSIDGVGIIPAGSSRYTTTVRLGQSAAFVTLYHSSYRGRLSAHVSIDRDNRPILRAMMAPARRGRDFFYVWVRLRDRRQVGPLVAYLTIQYGSRKVVRELPFTLKG